MLVEASLALLVIMGGDMDRRRMGLISRGIRGGESRGKV